MTQVPLSNGERAGHAESPRAKAYRDGVDDGGLGRSFFTDGRAMRAACGEVPLSQEEKLGHLRIIRDSRREIIRELAGAPVALQEVIGLCSRHPAYQGKKVLEAAWEDTVREWQRPHDGGWSERYAARLESNRELVLAALEHVASVVQHRHDVVLKLEERVRATFQRHERATSGETAKKIAEATRQQEEAALLSIDAIEAMQKRVAAFEHDAAPSFECMVRTNLRFVGACAAKFYRSPQNSQSLDDLFQRGTLGLAAALKRFDPDLGTSITSYASPWIRNAMRRGVVEEATIQVPERVQYVTKTFRVAASALTQSLGRKPHDDEVAAVTGAKLSAIHRAEPSVVSLSFSEQTRSDEAFTMDIAESRVVPVRDPEITRENGLAIMIARVFDGDEKLLSIMNARHQMGGNRGVTLKELADQIGITRERVRQLEIEAVGLLSDYVVVNSVGDRRRFEIAARVLQPFERPLLRNLVADEYLTLARGEFVGPEGKPVSAVEQRRVLVKSAVSLVLAELGETRATEILSRIKPRNGSILSEEQQTVILHRLFGPIREWSETTRLVENLFGSIGRSANGVEVTERRFRSAVESIAAPLRDVWRRELAGR